MTTTLALTGKSGSGKTTFVKGFCDVIKEKFPEKTILLVDNDLTQELTESFGLSTRTTIYGIRSGKHEYRTGIPSGMTKQEYIEWALEDILVSVDENVDIIASWLVASKDCRCPITRQMDDALVKLIERYDFVIFDCEFDLNYLNQLVDYPIDTTLIITNPDLKSVHLANNIYSYSQKYADKGQMGIILNKIKEQDEAAIEQASSFGLNILGRATKGEDVKEAIKNFYPRLNLPQTE
ncbi:CooC-like Ni insertion maturation factor [Candidatus Gastranaerophilus sp. (ex Termes propinquus)]|nr:CooC-like Ni insertion maturation factor [Candidatus Gastranaerophilus sp. (ex Termes propinquus)]